MKPWGRTISCLTTGTPKRQSRGKNMGKRRGANELCNENRENTEKKNLTAGKEGGN